MEDLADADGRPLLYQIICLQNTPPVSSDEQERCLLSRKKCWRLRKRGSAAADGPADDTQAGSEAAAGQHAEVSG